MGTAWMRFHRKGTSAFSGRIGQQVTAGYTVIDDGTIDRRRGSLNVDDEGNPTQRTVLIEDGILRCYMQDRLNARLMGLGPTGNGRRESFAHMPMPRMTNTIMLAGSIDPAEIIASVKDGLYAANFGGGQVDITSGKFVFSTVEAWMIKDGKLAYPVKGATLIGNGPDALTRVSMVGTDLELDSGWARAARKGRAFRWRGPADAQDRRSDGGRHGIAELATHSRMGMRSAARLYSSLGLSAGISWPGSCPSTACTPLRQARTGIETGGYPPMVVSYGRLRAIRPGAGRNVLVQTPGLLRMRPWGRALGAGTSASSSPWSWWRLHRLRWGRCWCVWKDVAFGGLMVIAYAVSLHYCRKGRSTDACRRAGCCSHSPRPFAQTASPRPACTAAIAWMIGRPRLAQENPLAPNDGPKRLFARSLLSWGSSQRPFGFVTLNHNWRLRTSSASRWRRGSAGTQIHDVLGISVCLGRKSRALDCSRRDDRGAPAADLSPRACAAFAGAPTTAGSVGARGQCARGRRLGECREDRASLVLPPAPCADLLHAIGANSGPVFYLVQADVFP